MTALAVRSVGGSDLSAVTSAWAPYTLIEAPGSTVATNPAGHGLEAHRTPAPGRFGSAVESALELMIRTLCDPIVEPPRQCVDFDEEPLGHQSMSGR